MRKYKINAVEAQLELFSAEAAEIRKLHTELLGHVRITIKQAIRIGELLTAVKEGLEHGRWLPWLKANVEFHERTARRYIRVFENREQLKTDSVSDLTDAYRLLADKVPREEKQARDFADFEWPQGKFRVLYADPPWTYNDHRLGSVDGGGATGTYSTMSLEGICNLDIPNIALPDSVLFLWITSPLLPDGLTVMGRWGFTYKASFIWDKVQGFNGHYNDVRHELLLVGTKGTCLPEVSELLDSVIEIKKTNHSEKPERFPEIIDLLYPSGPRLELFARKQRKGWKCLGNEA